MIELLLFNLSTETGRSGLSAAQAVAVSQIFPIYQGEISLTASLDRMSAAVLTLQFEARERVHDKDSDRRSIAHAFQSRNQCSRNEAQKLPNSGSSA